MLGCVDDVCRDPEHAAVDVGAAAGQASQRRSRPGKPVGRLVHGSVPTEGDDRVVALLGRLAADLGRVIAAFGVDGVDGVAPPQGGDDEVLEPARDGRRVGVDDHQQALAFLLLRATGVGQQVNAGVVVGHAHDLESGKPAACCGREQVKLSAAAPIPYTDSSHSSTHPEGWREMALRSPGNRPQGNGAKSIRLQRLAWEMWVGRYHTSDP